MNPTVYTIALGLLSGVLLIAAARVPGAWVISFVALIPLFEAVFSASSRRSAFFAGASAGVCAVGAATIWFFDVLPLPEAFGIYSLPAGVAFVLISWTVVVGALGAMVGLWALAAFELRRHQFALIAISGLFVLFEYIQMIVFNVVTYNSGVANPLFFSAGFVGYPLADSNAWLQAATLGGILTLSIIAVSVNALFVFLWRLPEKRMRITGIVTTLVVIGTISLTPVSDIRAHFDSGQSSVSVAALSVYAPIVGLDNNFKPFEEHIGNSIRSAEEKGADIIILPEDSRFFEPFSSFSHASVLRDGDAVVVDSGVFPPEGDGARLIRAFAHTATQTIPVADKQILTPQGEYLPFAFKLILRAAGAGDQLERFLQMRNLVAGEEKREPVAVSGARGSVLFCLEVMKPGIAERLVKEQESDFLIVMASHAWFGQSDTLAQDVLRFTQIQAVDAGVPVASSANFRSAYMLDKYGRITAFSGENGFEGAAIGTMVIQ